jgi:hypothetical protein
VPEKTIPFRLYAQILIFLALVALGMLILVPIQRAIQAGMIGIRDDLITRMEQRIDRKIRYSSISPSLFGSFDVRNVRIMGHDGAPVLTMSRFRVAYSLLDLLRGRVQAIHNVRIDSPFIDLNTTRDQDLIELFENFNSAGNSLRQDVTAIFPERLMVRIRNGKCLILDGRDQFDLDALNLNFEIIDDRVILDGRWNVGARIDKVVGSPVQLYVAMRLSGSCRRDMKEGEAVLSIPSITGDVLSASPIAFGFVLENSVLRMGKMPDALPFDFLLVYGLDDKRIDAQFDCTDFRLSEFLSFYGGLSGVRHLLDIASSGTASFQRGQDGSLGYAVNLSGAALASRFQPSSVMRASFAIDIAGDESYARVNTLRFSIPKMEGSAGMFFFGDIGFSGSVGLGPFAPDGILSLGNFSPSGRDGLNADIVIHSRDGADGREITVSCDTLRMGQVDLSRFSALLRPAGDDMGFTVSAVRFSGMETAQPPNGPPNGPASSLALEGKLNSPSRRVKASLRLNSFSAGDLAGMTTPFIKNGSVPAIFKGVMDKTVVTTEIFFDTDFADVSYNAPRFAFTNGTGKGFTGLVALSGTDRRFDLNEGRFTWGEETLLLSGSAEFAASKSVHFFIHTNYRNLGYSVEGALDEKSVNIRGSHGLRVSLAAAGDKGYTGSMRADGFPVPFLGRPAYCSFAAQLRYDTSASWSMNLERFELTNIASPAGLAEMRISGSADQKGASFPALYYRDPLGPLGGRADILWAADYSGFTGTAIMREGAESYHAGSSFADNRFGLVLAVSSMRLDRVFSRVKAQADGEIRVSWNSIDSFRVELNLDSVRGEMYGQEFGARAYAVMDSGELAVSGLSFNFADLQGSMSHFNINGVQGTAETSIEVIGLAGGRPVEGGLSLNAGFKPIRSWLEINEIVNSLDGNVHVAGFRYGVGAEAQNFDFVFSRSAGALSVSGGPRNMLRFRIDQDGSFYGGLSSPFPVRGTFIGSIKQKTIDATCGDLYVDLGELFNLLPESPELYLTGGYVNGSVDIKGSLIDPEFFGSARATSVRIRIPKFLTHELRPIPFAIAIDGNEMRFGPVATSVGGGAGTASGWFLFDRWIPDTFSIDVAVPRETPIPFGFDLGGFVAQGNASGNLNVSMESRTFDISGDLYANNTEMGINHEEIVVAGGGNAMFQAKFPFAVDLTVSTGPVVEFFYPSSRLPILRANPDMGTKIHFTADSQTQQYSLTSDVKIRSGEIFYFERNFYIRSGTLVFRENELHFAPRLTARAEVRDRTEDGPVTISMIVDNAPLLSFTARFESSPSLSQMEIFSLLGQNIAGSQFNESTDAAWRAVSSSLTDFAAQLYVVRQVERVVRNFTRLDMFSVRTQVLQNALLMSTGIMQPTVDRNSRLGNYLDNTTVFGGKYIGQDMFVQGMLSMRYEGERGVTFAPDIGVELQNPLFSIRWDFIPTHPENWYVNDNSITLIKSWSF